MKTMKFDLLEKRTEHDFMPTLTAYLLDGNPDKEEIRPAVLVIPGGGYEHVSFREGERIALFYNAAGFHAFILDYCVAPHRHPLPIMNAARAIELIRENAKDWNVAPDKMPFAVFLRADIWQHL